MQQPTLHTHIRREYFLNDFQYMSMTAVALVVRAYRKPFHPTNSNIRQIHSNFVASIPACCAHPSSQITVRMCSTHSLCHFKLKCKNNEPFLMFRINYNICVFRRCGCHIYRDDWVALWGD